MGVFQLSRILFFEKNFSCEAFMVISLIGFTTILSKTINYYRKYYIIFQLEKLSEIISMTLSKKLPIVTLFGEIFYPKDKTVFADLSAQNIILFLKKIELIVIACNG